MLLAEEPAQLRDRDAQARLRRRRRALAPELVGQPVARHGLVRVDEQEGEERALPCPDERSRDAVDPDLERAEQAKLEAVRLPSPREFRPRLRRVTERLQPARHDRRAMRTLAATIAILSLAVPASGAAPGRALGRKGDPGRQAPRGRRARGGLAVGRERRRQHRLAGRPGDEHGHGHRAPARPRTSRTRRSPWPAAGRCGSRRRRPGRSRGSTRGRARSSRRSTAPKVVDDILVADGSLWVASFDPYRCSANHCFSRLTRISTRTNTVTATFDVDTPTGLAAGYGSLWIVNHRTGAVTRFDPRTGQRRGDDRRPAPARGHLRRPRAGRRRPRRRLGLAAVRGRRHPDRPAARTGSSRASASRGTRSRRRSPSAPARSGPSGRSRSSASTRGRTAVVASARIGKHVGSDYRGLRRMAVDGNTLWVTDGDADTRRPDRSRSVGGGASRRLGRSSRSPAGARPHPRPPVGSCQQARVSRRALVPSSRAMSMPHSPVCV